MLDLLSQRILLKSGQGGGGHNSDRHGLTHQERTGFGGPGIHGDLRPLQSFEDGGRERGSGAPASSSVSVVPSSPSSTPSTIPASVKAQVMFFDDENGNIADCRAAGYQRCWHAFRGFTCAQLEEWAHERDVLSAMGTFGLHRSATRYDTPPRMYDIGRL